MSKSLLNLLVQMTKVCQKSELQIKFEKVLFIELGPTQVFGPAAWALAFGRPTPPPLLLGLGFSVGSAQPDPLPPSVAQPRRRCRWLTRALPPPGAPPLTAPVMARAPPHHSPVDPLLKQPPSSPLWHTTAASRSSLTLGRPAPPPTL
jgi:hypothetical protein